MKIQISYAEDLNRQPGRRAILLGDDGGVLEYGDYGDSDAEAVGNLVLKRPELLGAEIIKS